MAGFAEWSNNKKKQETEQPIAAPKTAESFTQWSNEKNGIVTPQTYRNQNKSFENSGLSRDAYDSSVRQNYAARAAASAPTLKTSGGYYSQPTVGAELERYGNTVSVYEADLQKKKQAVENANAELEKLQGELTAAGSKMENLYSFAQSGGIAAGLFQRAQQDYMDILDKYEAAAQTADEAYSAYEPAYNQYMQAVNAYEDYRTQQQGIYDDWKGTIRGKADIQTEIGSVESRMQELEEERKSLAFEKAGANQMQRRGGRDTGTRVAQIDTRLQEIEQQNEELEKMKALLQEEMDWSEYFKWEDYRSAEDFTDKSKYVSTYQPGTEKFNALSGTYTDTGFGDINYDYINRDETALGRQNVNDINMNLSFFGLDDSERQQMTDEEIALFNYLYAMDTERGDAEHSTAYAYIEYLTSDLNYRQRKKDEEYWASYAKESPVGSSVFSVLTSPLKGLSYLGQFADYVADGAIDQNEGYNKFSYMNTAIRNEVSNTIEESGNWGKVGSFAYNTGMSMADFLFNTAITGGFAGGGTMSEAAALAIMGTGAAADTVISAKDRGLSDGKAFALGTIAGAAEILTEKFSIEALLSGKWEESAIKYILKNAVTEGSEEVGSDIINTVADILIAKDQSQWQADIDAYMAQGKSESEAFGLALAKQAAEMGLDFLGGALSGGVTASAGAGIGTLSRNAAYRQTGASLRKMGDEMMQAIIDTGLQTNENTEAHRLAAELQEKLKSGTITDTEIGKLFSLASGEVIAQSATTTQEEAAENAPLRAELPMAEQAGAGEALQEAELPTKKMEPEKAALQEKETEPARAELPTAQTELERTAAMYGVEQETAERVQRIADIVGRNIVFYASDRAGENGYRDKETNTLYINARSQNPVAQIISHELTHSLEETGSYGDFQKLVLNRIQQTGGDIEQLRRNKEALYASKGVRLETPEAIDQEIVAEYVEKNLLTDEASIREIVHQNRSVGQKILSWLNDLIAKLGNRDAQQRAFLTQARNLYATALQESQSSFTREMAYDNPYAEKEAAREGTQERTTAQEGTQERTNAQTASESQTIDTESDEYLMSLRNQLAEGEITEAEFDRLFDEYYEGGSENQYSFGGRNANAADLNALRRAQEMEKEGVAAETIFRETGWYTGADGKWRFEIDDSGMEYNRENEGAQTLADILQHDELFRNYPQLRKTRVEFQDLGRGITGQYNSETDTITLSNELRDAPEGTLIHEIQHAIQKAEGFASGANTKFWERQLESGYDGKTQQQRREVQRLWQEYNSIRDTEPDFFAAMVGLEAMAPDVPRGAINWDTLEQIEEDPIEWQRYDAAREKLEEQYGNMKVWDFTDLRYKLKQAEMNAGRSATDLYYDTAGEIEARDTARRRPMTAEERRNTMPDTGNEDTVFTETAEDDRQYSISETLGEDLQKVLDGTFQTRGNEVYIGETSNFLTDVIGADSLRVTMPSSKAYSAMVTEEQARADGRYDEDVNYHGLGIDGLMKALEASENPVAAFADTGNENGKRAGNIVLATDEVGEDGNIVVVEALNAKGYLQGKRIEANKVVSSYDRRALANDIIQAAADGRLLHLDKKRSQTILAGVSAVNPQRAIQEVDFEKNIQDFWANVKWAQSGNTEYSSEGSGEEKTAFARAYEEAQKKRSAIETKQQFSFSEPVEQTGTLLALHNMDEEKIMRTLDIGAWPSPSIAIVQATQGHADYGEYSAIFPRSVIDMEADARNKVYGGDAWTPTHQNARVDYEVDDAKAREVERRIAELSRKTAGGAFTSSSVLRGMGIENDVTEDAQTIAQKLAGRDEVRAAYAADNGITVEPVYKAKEYGQWGNKMSQKIIDGFGAQELASMEVRIETREGLTEQEKERFREIWKQGYIDGLSNRMRERLEATGRLQQRADERAAELADVQIEDTVSAAWQMYSEGGGVSTEIDRIATSDALRAAVDDAEVQRWAAEQIDGILGEPGIYNGEDPYTRSGNRKGFSDLHWEYTAENIVRAMNNAEARGANYWGVGAAGMHAVATSNFRNVDEMHAEESRLYQEDEETHKARFEALDGEIDSIVQAVKRTNKAHSDNSFEEGEIIGSVLMQAAQGERTANSIKRTFRKEGYTISDALAEDILQMLKDAAAIPTGYFEAKPERVVNFEEAAAVLAPDNAPIELLARMRAAGMNVMEYEAGNEEARLELANSLNTQFSISEETDKRKIISDLRGMLNSGATAAQLRRYVDGLNEPVNLPTYEQNEAQQIVNDAHAENMSVQDYLNYNWEMFERDGQLNEEAREALRLEKQRSRRQYSVEGDIRDTLPEKARAYLARTERTLLEKVSTALSVPSFAKREYLQDIVREISDEYLRDGAVKQETVDRLFDTAYDEGIVVDDEYYQQYKEIKNHLRTQAVTISEQDKHDIADWNDFRKSAFGTLRIVNEGGLPVDVAYQELQGMARELFPDDIVHPADQLMRMFEVARSIEKAEKSLDEYYGREAEDFRSWAKNDFDTAVYETIGELKNVKRYADERAQTQKAEQVTTQEEVAEAYKQLKEARRTYEKAAAKHLLTDHDNVQVGRLLKGEIEPENLDPAKDNIKGITAVYEAKREYERLSKLIKEWNNQRRAELRDRADGYLETANDWKDKKVGILYSRETMERNILDIVKDKKLAQTIIDEYFAPVHKAQADATRLKNRFREQVKALNLNTRETKAMQRKGQVSEAHAVQLIGEAMDNIRMLENSRGRMEQRDGKTLSDWRGIVQDLWAQNPQLNRAKIEGAIEEFRKIYDELFRMMNESRLRNGYEPVNYRKGYFPHFQPGDGDGIMGLFGRALGISTDVSALPTTINGLTHTFRPGIQWFGNAQERLGFNTAYDAVEGFDRYIEGVADVIYQTDNIQKLRALSTQVRYRTGEEGIRKQIDAVYADQTLSEQDKQNRIEKIFESGRYALSNFVVELEEYTNLLANKKSRADRNMEQALGRDMYNLVKALESRVAANMVAINPASWLTNFIPLTQGGAQLNKGALLKGMWQTLRAYKESDGIVDASTFLTNRRGSEPLVRTWAQKASAKMSSPMEFIDQFTSDSLVRGRYYQNLRQGLSEAEAMAEADSWVAGVMADRSKGSMPTLFNRSNPLTKLFTQFQLEVNNQLSYLFKDMPREQKDKGLAALAAALIKFFLGAWLYDEVYEYFIGRRPALDPLGILNDTVGDITGYELPNLVEMGVGAVTGDMPSFETEKQNAYDTTKNLLGTVAEEMPFIGGLMGGGRLPISSALPDWDNLLKTVTSDTWSTKKKLATAGKEIGGKTLTYLALPFGGGQLKKIYQGLDAVIRGGSYSVDAEGNDLLQYPVFNDDPWSTAAQAGQAVLFGKTSLKTGRDWIESGFKTFGAKETAAYQAMTDAGVPDEDAYDLLLTLRRTKKTETESEAELERRALRNADISGDGKSVVYYGLMASDKERELMDAMTDANADMGTVTQVLMDVKDAGSLTGAAASNAKRTALAESALTDTEKQTMYRYLFGTQQDDGTYTSSRDDDIMAFQQAGLDMDTFLKVQNEYSTINEEHDGAGEKATEFSRWVNNADFTPEQAEVVKDCFTYYSQIPAEAARYENFVAAGLEDDAAYELANTIGALKPMEGKDSVTDEQKWRAVVDSGLTETEQLDALEAVSTESQYRKFLVAYDFGVMPGAYVTARETMPKFDADGNGSYKNDEITAAINSMGTSAGGIMLPGGDGITLTNDQKAALWQLLTGSASAKNNPYSSSVGWAVIDAVNAMKEGNTGIVLPDGTNYTGGIVLPKA